VNKKPATIRNQESRARKRERGLIRCEVQIYAEDRDAVYEFVAILRAKRQTATQEQPQ
jgi:hypothetical protein